MEIVVKTVWKLYVDPATCLRLVSLPPPPTNSISRPRILPTVLPPPKMSSWFGQQSSGPDPLFLAKTEIEMYNDLFVKMSSTCFLKCRSNFKEPDLNIGEQSCIDRCSSKYMEAQEKVGEVMKRVNEQAEAQQKAMQDMQR